jgi:hypothetical protein
MLTEFGVVALLKNGPPVKTRRLRRYFAAAGLPHRQSAPAQPCSQRAALIFSGAYMLDATLNESVRLPALRQSGNGGIKP